MTPGSADSPPLAAALAGIPAGIRATGPWTGRRQLFVKFARPAETATMYTADALRGELARLAQRSVYHSIALSGGDPLAEVEFLAAALEGGSPLAVMLDHDGQRPESLDRIIGVLALVQVTLTGAEDDAAVARAMATLRGAAAKHVAHALVLTAEADASDGRLLRIVEQTEAASPETSVVLHPSADSLDGRNRRWIRWLEQAAGVHGDVRLLPRLPEPTGMR
jgi:organic radical activating enzyme